MSHVEHSTFKNTGKVFTYDMLQKSYYFFCVLVSESCFRLRWDCFHASRRFSDASAQRLSCFSPASSLRHSRVTPASTLRPIRAPPASFAWVEYSICIDREHHSCILILCLLNTYPPRNQFRTNRQIITMRVSIQCSSASLRLRLRLLLRLCVSSP